MADAYPRLTIFLIEVIVGRLIDSTTCSSLVYSGIKGLDMLEGDLWFERGVGFKFLGVDNLSRKSTYFISIFNYKKKHK